ncbi:50S ribosomal protein L10 [Oceanivirga miroungae]|uniref:Large ribosomal subunit protein uL10 n=1 Tax=Oceanivirga miroungae TaxID=1130046 RepID=A0A6I8MB45_9FUSO|nr:50S ribosomal protein L10 [Oceanivirga miroungae]VWL85423.1 50S ribosomal protein L10 [Oceanivirga miroungae]
MAAQYKVEEVAKLVEKLRDARSVVFSDYKGITVNEDTKLRRNAREAGVDYFVAKNRLVQLAFKELGYNLNFGEMLEGTTSFAVSKVDAVAPAKLIYNFQKESKKLEIKGGFYNNGIADKATMEAIAKLPSREEMLGMIAYGLLSPVRMLAVGLSNLAEQKEA